MGTGKSIKSIKSIIVFSKDGCAPCRNYAPIVEEAQSLGLSIKKIDISSSPEYKQQYGLSIVPTTILLEDDKEVQRLTGFVGLSKLKQLLEV